MPKEQEESTRVFMDLELFLRRFCSNSIREKFELALLKNAKSNGIEILSDYGFSNDLPLEVIVESVFKSQETYFLYKEMEEIIIPVKKARMDQNQAKKQRVAMRDSDNTMENAGRPYQLQSQRTKSNTGKRRTLNFNAWGKKR